MEAEAVGRIAPEEPPRVDPEVLAAHIAAQAATTRPAVKKPKDPPSSLPMPFPRPGMLIGPFRVPVVGNGGDQPTSVDTIHFRR
jgi:hypothetical protein